MLKLAEIENFFHSLTMQILGINPSTPSNQGKVRIAYSSTGGPDWKHNEDVVNIVVNAVDDPFTIQRDTSYEAMDADNSGQKTGYTRVHQIKWILYGPNSFDNAEIIKNGLFKPDSKVQCASNDLYLILDIVPPKRIPELHNMQWFERSDFSVRFNEKVELEAVVPVLKSANINTRKG